MYTVKNQTIPLCFSENIIDVHVEIIENMHNFNALVNRKKVKGESFWTYFVQTETV